MSVHIPILPHLLSLCLRGVALTFYIARGFAILNIAYGIYTGDIPSIGAYMTMMFAVDALKNSLNEIFYYVKDGSRLGMYAKRIRAFFEVESCIEPIIEGKVSARSLAYAVSFRNVSFTYQNSLFGINELNLEIRAGEKIAIVGENGAGKTTLVKLLLRLYDTTGGHILIDGVDIRNYDLSELRSKSGVAVQHTNIYAFSFSKNIMLYNESEEQELDEILKKTGLENVLDKNNGSLTTMMTKEFDENGLVLSGGEIQKVGIARLFSGEFGLLLLDEPSSALDPLAEYEMSKLILSSSNLSTTIIVAHRLSTIRDVDRIVLIDQGRIREIGTHDQLMSQQGKYFEMFTKQAENYVR